jgi:hypothetical protein
LVQELARLTVGTCMMDIFLWTVGPSTYRSRCVICFLKSTMRRVSSDMQDHHDNNTKLPEENDGRRTRLRTLIQWLFVCCRFFNQSHPFCQSITVAI